MATWVLTMSAPVVIIAHRQQEYAMYNPVAKHAHRFNKAVAFKNRKAYTRKSKHKNKD